MLRIFDQLTRNPRYDWDLFDRVFSQFSQGLPSPAPNAANTPLNVYAGETTARIVAQIPGWEAEWFELSTEGNRLILEGKRPKTEEQTEVTFKRTVNLPFRAEPDQIKATYKDGILTVDLEKSEQDRARTIKIEAA